MVWFSSITSPGQNKSKNFYATHMQQLKHKIVDFFPFLHWLTGPERPPSEITVYQYKAV